MIDGVTRYLSALIPEIRLPELGRRVEIPVYMIHNSTDPEDYFFIFDFEEFVERSRAGMFLRPTLKLWSGRSDFDRRLFARQFRQAFAAEFDAARAQMAAEGKNGSGWFDWMPSLGDMVRSATDFVPVIVLLVALSSGMRMVMSLFRPSFWRRRERENLEDAIEETKGHVDAALERLRVVVHMDLYRHAWRGARGGRLTGVEYDAWPLPVSVAQYLDIEGPECLPRS